jgi:hypothetical protein
VDKKMEVLFDLKLENGEVLEGVYFVEYEKPIKSGKHSGVLTWAKSRLSCFNKDGEEILGKNINNAILIRAYDKETGEDIMDFYNFFITAQMNLTNGIIARFPLAREVVKLGCE